MRTMATRKNFEAGLDKEPGDLVLRQVYADWLEELGFDDEAYAQRWMAQERKRPVPAAPRYFRGQWQWEWYGTRRYPGRPRSKHHAVLPQEVSRLLSYDSAVCGTDDGSAETFGFRGY